MERKNVNHAYPFRLWKQLKELANKTDLKLTTYVNQVLRKHVDSEKKKK